jgi:hypothetical protein
MNVVLETERLRPPRDVPNRSEVMNEPPVPTGKPSELSGGIDEKE